MSLLLDLPAFHGQIGLLWLLDPRRLVGRLRLFCLERIPFPLGLLLTKDRIEFGLAGGLIGTEGLRSLAGSFGFAHVLADPHRLVEVDWLTSVLAHPPGEFVAGRLHVVGSRAGRSRLG